MKQVKPEIESFARIRVIGVGGSGTNAVNYMVNSKVKGVDFVVVNTDAQNLHHSPVKSKIHIGKALTRGLGSGMNSETGKAAAEEQKDELAEAVKGSDMVFVTCGLGGGTGTGAAPVVAKLARESGALTIGVVTKPFSFEGSQRMNIADAGLDEMRNAVDSLLIIPNDRILETVPKGTGLKEAFAFCDDVLKQAVEGISDLITKDGIINVDFADIRTIMEGSGSALMGIGEAEGENRAVEAATRAISSPLLDVSVDGATGVLFAVSGRDDLGMHEVQEVADTITKATDKNAKIIFGTIYDEGLKKGAIKVTVVATGFDGEKKADIPTTHHETPEPKHEIHNTFDSPSLTEEKPEQKPEPKPSPLSPTPRPATDIKPKRVELKKDEPKKREEPEEDDDFSMIPSFLRRSKLK